MFFLKNYRWKRLIVKLCSERSNKEAFRGYANDPIIGHFEVIVVAIQLGGCPIPQTSISQPSCDDKAFTQYCHQPRIILNGEFHDLIELFHVTLLS